MSVQMLKKVGQSGIPIDIPMYFFISDGKEIGLANWRTMQANYISQLERGQYLSLDVGHYVHTWEPERIAEEIDNFIKR